jgi:predicted CoA-binding protein
MRRATNGGTVWTGGSGERATRSRSAATWGCTLISLPPASGLDYSIRAMDDINALRRILRESHVIAVVGLSADWYRPSYFAAKYMQEHGYRVIPVNPKYGEILGEKCYKSLREVPEKIDIVDVFRKTQDVMPIAEQAIAIGAKVLWQQLGVKNEAAAAKARAAGLDAVMDRCVKIEHGRLFGGLNWVGVNTRVISAKRPRWLAY